MTVVEAGGLNKMSLLDKFGWLLAIIAVIVLLVVACVILVTCVVNDNSRFHPMTHKIVLKCCYYSTI